MRRLQAWRTGPRLVPLRTRDIDWLAGLLEGEGCFTVGRTRGGCVPVINFAMTDRDVMERARRLMRGRTLYAQRLAGSSGTRKPILEYHPWEREGWVRLNELALPASGGEQRTVVVACPRPGAAR